MQEHSLSTSRTARYFTLGHPSDARELWFVCHGYGQLASRFLERFHSLESQRRCIVAPEGLSRFYLTEHPTERRVGASWMTREDRLHEIDDYVRYLDALHAVVASAEARVTAISSSRRRLSPSRPRGSRHPGSPTSRCNSTVGTRSMTRLCAVGPSVVRLDRAHPAAHHPAAYTPRQPLPARHPARWRPTARSRACRCRT